MKAQKNYLNYSLEDLLADQDFILWVNTNADHDLWGKLISDDSDFRIMVQKAREMLLLLEDQEDGLSQEEILGIWKKIDQYNNLGSGSPKPAARTVILLRNFLRYAALILILLSVSAFVTMYLLNKEKIEFLSDSVENTTGEPSLILSQGDVIPLKDNSWVVVKGGEQILINNEQSVNLKPNNTNPGFNEIVVPYGKKSFIVLSDSTRVWLCAGSKLAFPSLFTDKKREVFLEGEAYFEVSHLPEKPFLVRSSDVTVKVLGTKFYMASYNDFGEVITVLFDGSVALNGNNTLEKFKKQTILKPGQKAVFNKIERSLDINDEENVDLYVAWTKGWFSFSKENVSDVLRKLERYYNVKFIYSKPFDSLDQITGKLDLKESISDVLLTLSGLTDITYKMKNDSIYIEKSLNNLPMEN